MEVKSAANRADAASDGTRNKIGDTPENCRRQSERRAHGGRLFRVSKRQRVKNLSWRKMREEEHLASEARRIAVWA